MKIACALALFVSVALPRPAAADTWACEVLLCLSNPAGPTAVSQCVAPIKKLWRHLARGNPFPVCEMNNSDSHYARHEWSSGRFCPAGYEYIEEDGTRQCLMQGAVTVYMNGVPQSRTWWASESEAVFEPSVGTMAPVRRVGGRDGDSQ